jgi:hypothetical protein
LRTADGLIEYLALAGAEPWRADRQHIRRHGAGAQGQAWQMTMLRREDSWESVR